jgi:hypothetical protein
MQDVLAQGQRALLLVHDVQMPSICCMAPLLP